MIKERLIESIVNRRDSFDKSTISLIKQYLILDVLSLLKDGTFKEFGCILNYKFDENILEENIKFDVKNCYYDMKLPYVVLKNEDSIYILDIEKENENSFGIKVNRTIAYIYKSIIYIDEYIEDSIFYEEVKKSGFELGNVIQHSFTKDLYKEVLFFYNNIKEEKFFKERVEKIVSKKECSIIKDSKPTLIKEFIEFFTKEDFVFSLEDINADIYFDIFKGEEKDRILNTLLIQLHDKDYKKYTKSLYEYVLSGSEYIDSIIENKKEYLIKVLANKQAKNNLKRILIDDSKEVLSIYQSLCIFNREVVHLYESIKDVIDNVGCKKISISFDGESFTDISSSIKCDESIVSVDDIKLQSINIFTNVWSQKSNLIGIVSLNNIRSFIIKYKGNEIFKADNITIDKLNHIRNNINLKDIIN